MRKKILSESIETKGIKFCFPGSFDPWTRGHLSVITSFLSRDPDENIEVIIGKNLTKKGTFTPEERKFIIEKSIPQEFLGRVKVTVVDGIIANYMYQKNIPYFIKSIRDTKDYDYEFELAQVNNQLYGAPLTLLIPQVNGSLSTVSSSNLKMLANLGIKLDKYASGFVREILKMKSSQKLLIGVTGGIASGKSTFCTELVRYAADKDLKIYHINMDNLGHDIYSDARPSPLFKKIREQTINVFGETICNSDGTINRKILGEIIFASQEKLDRLTEIMNEPILFLLSEKLKKIDKGIILIESAILIERKLTELVDDNLILIHASQEVQIKRMQTSRALTKTQALKRIWSQGTYQQNRQTIESIHINDFDRLFMDISTDATVDISTAFKKLETEYYRRLEVRRIGPLFIPQDINFDNDRTFFAIIKQYYTESQRAYHTLQHIEEMLLWFQKVKHLLKYHNEFYLAIIFHDIIYDIKRKDNELASAEVAKKYLSEHLQDGHSIYIDKVVNMIKLTAEHGKNFDKELTVDEQLFVDIDMTIFIADKNRLLEYEQGINKEYSQVYSAEEYKKSRLDFLKSIEKVFISQYFKERYEEIALQNIKFIIKHI